MTLCGIKNINLIQTKEGFMEKKGLFFIVRLILLSLILIIFPLITSNLWSAEQITLTFGGLWAPTHHFSIATQQWIDKIEKETGGRIKIKPYWARALYSEKNSARELAKGVADIGDYSGAYAPSGWDFEKSMRMAFWGVSNKDVVIKVWNEVLTKYHEIEAEHTNAGIKVMAWGPIPPYQLISKKPVRKIEDLKGLVIKVTGDFAKLAPLIGAEGTIIPMGETYLALQKGTVDGAFTPYETLKTFRFAEVIKYAIELNIGSAPSGHWGMSMKSWNKLPHDIQKVFEQNVDWFNRRIAELGWEKEEIGKAEGKKYGVEFIKFPKGDLEKIYSFVDRIVRAEMAKIDAKGLPGTAVYEEIRSLIKKYGE